MEDIKNEEITEISQEHTEETEQSTQQAEEVTTAQLNKAPAETIPDPIAEQSVPVEGLNESQVKSMIQSELKTQKRSHPILTILLAGLVGLGSGYGGSVLANRNTSSQTTSEPAVSTPATTTTAVSSAATGTALSIKDVAAIASPTVVEITVKATETVNYGFWGGWGYGNGNDNNTYTSTAAGSGVIITTDGYIITNHHVVEGGEEFTVRLSDGTEYSATLIGSDSKTDIAVLKIDANNLTAASIGDSSTIAAGDTAIVIGNPLGTLGGTVTNGIISATSRTVTINNESMELIQTNAAINSGNSGGGMFNDHGQLIGIVNAKDSGTTSSGATIEGLGFAIPINTAIDVANQLIKNGYVTDRPTIGVMLSSVTQSYGNVTAGLYISEVIEDSGAEEAGLKAGDRIIAIDSTDAETYQALSAYLKTKSIGDTVRMTVIRDGQQMDFDVTLTAPIQSN